MPDVAEIGPTHGVPPLFIKRACRKIKLSARRIEGNSGSSKENTPEGGPSGVFVISLGDG
jgi:hypothetical protein